MSEYEPLHLKYRPKTLDDFIGNGIAVRTLEDTLAKKGKPHSYLFHGPSGCGKTTLARITARMLGCSDMDYHELNSGHYGGADAARDLILKSKLRPWKGEVVVYLLDEAHMITTTGQNILLKLLEEPPSHCYFLLCTTEPNKLLKTIHTRCAQFPVAQLGRRAISTALQNVYDCEVPGQELLEELVQEITYAANGSMRTALMILDQVMGIEDLDEAIDAVQEATGAERQVIELCRALIKTPKWDVVAPVLAGLQGEPEASRYAILGYFNTVALKAKDPWVSMVVIKHLTPSVMYSAKAGLAYACWRVVEELQHKEEK